MKILRNSFNKRWKRSALKEWEKSREKNQYWEKERLKTHPHSSPFLTLANERQQEKSSQNVQKSPCHDWIQRIAQQKGQVLAIVCQIVEGWVANCTNRNEFRIFDRFLCHFLQDRKTSAPMKAAMTTVAVLHSQSTTITQLHQRESPHLDIATCQSAETHTDIHHAQSMHTHRPSQVSHRHLAMNSMRKN